MRRVNEVISGSVSKEARNKTRSSGLDGFQLLDVKVGLLLDSLF
jgi:hypothetical protein